MRYKKTIYAKELYLRMAEMGYEFGNVTGDLKHPFRAFRKEPKWKYENEYFIEGYIQLVRHGKEFVSAVAIVYTKWNKTYFGLHWDLFTFASSINIHIKGIYEDLKPAAIEDDLVTVHTPLLRIHEEDVAKRVEEYAKRGTFTMTDEYNYFKVFLTNTGPYLYILPPGYVEGEVEKEIMQVWSKLFS